jgi:hypothetical protein
MIQVSIASEDWIKMKLPATSCLTQYRPSPSHEVRQETDSPSNHYSLSTTKDPTLAWRRSHWSISLRHSVWRIFIHAMDVNSLYGDRSLKQSLSVCAERSVAMIVQLACIVSARKSSPLLFLFIMRSHLFPCLVRSHTAGPLAGCMHARECLALVP